MDYFELLKGHIQEKEEIMGRLCNLEGFWVKCLLRFKAEDDTFRRLQRAVAEKDQEGISEYLHMFKGVVLNLGFSRMSELTVRLQESIREGNFDSETFACLEREYDAVIAKLSLAERMEEPDSRFEAI